MAVIIIGVFLECITHILSTNYSVIVEHVIKQIVLQRVLCESAQQYWTLMM